VSESLGEIEHQVLLHEETKCVSIGDNGRLNNIRTHSYESNLVL